MANRISSHIALILITLLVTGCVTTVESRLTRKADPDKAVENYTQLGLGYIQQGRYDRARARLNRALEINPEYPGANTAMAILLQVEGEPQEARQYFEKTLDLDDEFSKGHYHFGLFLMQNKEYEKACHHLKQAAQDIEFQQRGNAYTNLGLCYYRNGDVVNAIKTYKRTLKVQRYNAQALVNLSAVLFEEAQYQESQQYFARFQQLVNRKQSQHSANSLWLGIKLAQVQGSTQKAAQLAAELGKKFPDSNEYQLYKKSL